MTAPARSRPGTLPAALAALTALLLALGVLATPASAADPGTTLTWLGNAEIQQRPFAGGSNYLSAGASDGTQATYAAAAGNVAILQQSGSGAPVPATWETRAAHVASGGRQLVVVSGGSSTVAGDGTRTVTWTGSWSVNFYGGMVPFTVSDPKLTVGPTGTGTLTATLSGYGSDMDNPSVKHPLAPVPGVVVATFSGATFDEDGFTVTPDYAGVTAELPQDQTQQNRTASGWGAWPQSFVDFQLDTGLSSYWYSSGTSLDSKKPPLPISVGPTAVVPPVPPKPSPDPVAPVAPPAPRAPIAPVAPAPPVAPPVVTAARISASKRVRTIDRQGRVAVATITCPNGASACRVTTPKRTRITVAGTRYTATVLAVQTVKAGTSASVRVRLPQRAVVRLRGRSARLSVRVTTTVQGRTTSRTVRATVRGAAAKRGATN